MFTRKVIPCAMALLWLVTLSWQAFGKDVYKSPAIKYNTNMAKFGSTLKVDTQWDKGMEYRVLERPVIVRDIASDDGPEEDENWSRDPASHGPKRPVHYQKFVPAPYIYK